MNFRRPPIPGFAETMRNFEASRHAGNVGPREMNNVPGRIVSAHSIVLAAIVCMLLCCRAGAGEGVPDEYLVKAAFVYNIAQFVEWPADAFSSNDSPILIGILGTDPLSDALSGSIQDKNAKGRAVVVRHFMMDPGIRQCQIIVVTTPEAKQVGALREIIQGAPILTVGESDGFAHHGGIINLVLENGRIRMEINTTAADLARLKISSKVLNLARIVK